MQYLSLDRYTASLDNFKGNHPFDHCVIDNFFELDIASTLEAEFLDYEDKKWFYYKNAIEDKKALNDWNLFPATTYKVLMELMSPKFVEFLGGALGMNLYVDHGLHGGGWHMHGPGGNLNPHLDYSIHPKMNKLRKLNIIIYLSSSMKPDYGGHLGLWTHSDELNAPNKLAQEIEPLFNRAIIFDTTQNSWHGMSRPLVQPKGIYRKSLAIYYLTELGSDADSREKALFAPREEQKGRADIEELIRVRADSKSFSDAYQKQ